jgi:phospholipase D3/4
MVLAPGMMRVLICILFCFLGSVFTLLDSCVNTKPCTCGADALTIVESIPLGVDLPHSMSTLEGWETIINSSKQSIDIAAFYFTLTEGEKLPEAYGGWMGIRFYNSLIAAARQRNVKIRIVQNIPSRAFTDQDTQELQELGVAEVKNLDWTKLVGLGVLHTKMIIVDNRHAYVGSANMDWRSLSQVKELGLLIQNCSVLVDDARKAFGVYWHAADTAVLPPAWPNALDAQFNMHKPAHIMIDGIDTEVFLASSPRSFCAEHRTTDIDALLHVINTAKRSISISVMDYSASTLYQPTNHFWPTIDNALRDAAFNRGVKIRLLVSQWNYSNPIIFQFSRSLNSIQNIKVKLFQIGPDGGLPPAPYTRVNHAKYMVTDSHTYIGTSNWSADYFLNTGGLSYTLNNPSLTSKLQAIFERDWESQYANPID